MHIIEINHAQGMTEFMSQNSIQSAISAIVFIAVGRGLRIKILRDGGRNIAGMLNEESSVIHNGFFARTYPDKE